VDTTSATREFGNTAEVTSPIAGRRWCRRIKDEDGDGIAILQFNTLPTWHVSLRPRELCTTSPPVSPSTTAVADPWCPTQHPPTTTTQRTAQHGNIATALHSNASIQLPVHARLNSTTRQFHGACERQLCRPGSRHTPLCRALL
jgi:hypothetical protein